MNVSASIKIYPTRKSDYDPPLRPVIFNRDDLGHTKLYKLYIRVFRHAVVFSCRGRV
jgi:hypothetical protein